MNGKLIIVLGGISRTLWFNNYAKGALGAIYGVDPLEAGQKMVKKAQNNYVSALADVVFCGLEGYHEAEDLPKDYTLKDVKLWCAEASEDDLVTAFNAWLETSQIRDIVKAKASGGKKLPGRKS